MAVFLELVRRQESLLMSTPAVRLPSAKAPHQPRAKRSLFEEITWQIDEVYAGPASRAVAKHVTDQLTSLNVSSSKGSSTSSTSTCTSSGRSGTSFSSNTDTSTKGGPPEVQLQKQQADLYDLASSLLQVCPVMLQWAEQRILHQAAKYSHNNLSTSTIVFGMLLEVGGSAETCCQLILSVMQHLGCRLARPSAFGGNRSSSDTELFVGNLLARRANNALQGICSWVTAAPTSKHLAETKPQVLTLPAVVAAVRALTVITYYSCVHLKHRGGQNHSSSTSSSRDVQQSQSCKSWLDDHQEALLLNTLPACFKLSPAMKPEQFGGCDMHTLRVMGVLAAEAAVAAGAATAAAEYRAGGVDPESEVRRLRMHAAALAAHALIQIPDQWQEAARARDWREVQLQLYTELSMWGMVVAAAALAQPYAAAPQNSTAVTGAVLAVQGTAFALALQRLEMLCALDVPPKPDQQPAAGRHQTHTACGGSNMEWEWLASDVMEWMDAVLPHVLQISSQILAGLTASTPDTDRSSQLPQQQQELRGRRRQGAAAIDAGAPPAPPEVLGKAMQLLDYMCRISGKQFTAAVDKAVASTELLRFSTATSSPDSRRHATARCRTGEAVKAKSPPAAAPVYTWHKRHQQHIAVLEGAARLLAAVLTAAPAGVQLQLPAATCSAAAASMLETITNQCDPSFLASARLAGPDSQQQTRLFGLLTSLLKLSSSNNNNNANKTSLSSTQLTAPQAFVQQIQRKGTGKTVTNNKKKSKPRKLPQELRNTAAAAVTTNNSSNSSKPTLHHRVAVLAASMLEQAAQQSATFRATPPSQFKRLLLNPASYQLHGMPWLVLFGRCCLLWAGQLHPLQKQQERDSASGSWDSSSHLESISRVLAVVPLQQQEHRAERSTDGQMPFVPLTDVMTRVQAWLTEHAQLTQQSAAAQASTSFLLSKLDDVQLAATSMQRHAAAWQAKARQHDSSGHNDWSEVASIFLELWTSDLQKQLQSLGVALNTLAVRCVCANPSCVNVSGPSEQQLVSGARCMCGGCRTAHFCSRTCLQQHWSQHKPVCKALAAQQGRQQGSAAGGD